jgi:phage baseplate assembly protein W
MQNIAFPIRIKDGEIAAADYIDSVRQSVYLILSTAKGERLLHPDFGTDIHKYLFETLDLTNAELIRTEAVNAIMTRENRVSDIDAKVSLDTNSNSIVVNVTYKIKKYGNAVEQKIIVGNTADTVISPHYAETFSAEMHTAFVHIARNLLDENNSRIDLLPEKFRIMLYNNAYKTLGGNNGPSFVFYADFPDFGDAISDGFSVFTEEGEAKLTGETEILPGNNTLEKIIVTNPEIQGYTVLTTTAGGDVKVVKGFAKLVFKDLMFCDYTAVSGGEFLRGYGLKWRVDSVSADIDDKFAITADLIKKCDITAEIEDITSLNSGDGEVYTPVTFLHNGTDVEPELLYARGQILENEFFPFGSPFSDDALLYIKCGGFSGGSVTLKFDVSLEQTVYKSDTDYNEIYAPIFEKLHIKHKLPETVPIDCCADKVVLEYWDGSVFKPFFDCGNIMDGAGNVSVEFEIPCDVQPCEIAGNSGYRLCLHLKDSDYSGVFPRVLHSPKISGLTVSYACECSPKAEYVTQDGTVSLRGGERIFTPARSTERELLLGIKQRRTAEFSVYRNGKITGYEPVAESGYYSEGSLMWYKTADCGIDDLGSICVNVYKLNTDYIGLKKGDKLDSAVIITEPLNILPRRIDAKNLIIHRNRIVRVSQIPALLKDGFGITAEVSGNTIYIMNVSENFGELVSAIELFLESISVFKMKICPPPVVDYHVRVTAETDCTAELRGYIDGLGRLPVADDIVSFGVNVSVFYTRGGVIILEDAPEIRFAKAGKGDVVCLQNQSRN